MAKTERELRPVEAPAGFDPVAPASTLDARRRVPRQLAFVLGFIWRHPSNRGRRARVLARAVRFQVRGRLFRKSTITRIGARSKMWAHLHVYNSSKAVYANPPDWPEMPVWRNTLGPGDLFIDVGANVGIYTLWACEQGAEVVAVEPNADACARLRENLALNGYEADVVQAVLAAEPGIVRVTTDHDMGNHIVTDTTGTPFGPSRVEAMLALTLDQIIGDEVAAGVKIDVEGAESIVLGGATRALASQRIRLMQIEWNDCSVKLLGEDRSVLAKFLDGFGYELCRPNARGDLVPVVDPEIGDDVFARPRS